MAINFVVSGTSLIVTLNGEVLPVYSLYTQVPIPTTTATTASFLFTDGRYINNLPYSSVQFAGVPFSGTKSELDAQLTTTFTADNTGSATTDASALTTGTLPDARLSGIVAKNFTPTATKTSAYTAAANDLVKTDATSATVPIILPTGQPDKTRVAVKMIAVSGAFTTTIAAGGSAVFNKAGGSTSVSLTLLNQAVTFQYESTGSIWSVISSDVPLSQMDLRYATPTGTQTLSNKSIPSVLTPASDLTTIEAWGDSHTAGAGQTPWTTTLATLSGLTVNNNGVGGETSTQVKTRFDAASAGVKARPNIIWVGYNDYATDNTYVTVKSNIAAMVAALGHTSYLVIGELMGANAGFDGGAAGWLNKIQFNRDLAAIYGHHFFDVHSFIMQYYDPSNSTDLTNYMSDTEPNSLRIDLNHFTSSGNVIIGTEIYRRIKDIGVGTTALNRAEIYNSAISPINVGWGVKSPARFNYLEVDKLSIRANGALMFEGIPIFSASRRSYYIGEGSGTAQRTGTATTSLYNTVFGYGSLNNASLTGNLNTVIGSLSATNITSGANNVIIGNQIDANGATGGNGLNIMNMIFGAALNSTGTTLPTTGRIGIRQNNLSSTLHLGGSFATPIQAKTAAYTLTESDYTVNVTGATTANITLPTAVGCSGRIYVIKNSGSGVITVATTSSQTIDGATTYPLSTQYKYVTVQSNNANWIIIGNN